MPGMMHPASGVAEGEVVNRMVRTGLGPVTSGRQSTNATGSARFDAGKITVVTLRGRVDRTTSMSSGPSRSFNRPRWPMDQSFPCWVRKHECCLQASSHLVHDPAARLGWIFRGTCPIDDRTVVKEEPGCGMVAGRQGPTLEGLMSIPAVKETTPGPTRCRAGVVMGHLRTPPTSGGCVPNPVHRRHGPDESFLQE